MSEENFYDEEYTERLNEIMDLLKEHYGVPEGARRDDPVDSLITTILSQNTTDQSRDKAKARLDEKFDSFQEILDADVEEVTDAVRIAGLGPTKAERIQTFLSMIKEERGEFSLDHVTDMGKEEAKQYLQEFPGVGPKTAAVTLCFAFGMPVMPVDTHVHRLSQRLRLIPEGTPVEKAHDILEREVPDDRIYEFHINLIKHGRAVCTARNPTCQESFLAEYCVNCVCREN
ncbi:endonuclease III domain-containing protein [Candidatus Nanohalococcus occultus]|uniref:Endonuclease III n=1 Tax=Candidatus Nanohalococcus occultus TaxID=2978047 RepID=A0ABY8CEV9_9ARCH|nr:Endonuclease III [Candidatus Nanohaloarchaeota archaeon SVXNc]